MAHLWTRMAYKSPSSIPPPEAVVVPSRVADGLSEVSICGHGAGRGTHVDDRAGDPQPIAQRQVWLCQYTSVNACEACCPKICSQ